MRHMPIVACLHCKGALSRDGSPSRQYLCEKCSESDGNVIRDSWDKFSSSSKRALIERIRAKALEKHPDLTPEPGADFTQTREWATAWLFMDEETKHVLSEEARAFVKSDNARQDGRPSRVEVELAAAESVRDAEVAAARPRIEMATASKSVALASFWLTWVFVGYWSQNRVAVFGPACIAAFAAFVVSITVRIQLEEVEANRRVVVATAVIAVGAAILLGIVLSQNG